MAEERKLVTMLFADVAGSTALGDALDPEDVRALMARYYAHARRVIADHGGTLEKFIGDAVMAVFGFPHAHSDDAERALAAALALRAAVADDPALGPALQLRMGVNTGEVVAASDAASTEFFVTGDPVNVAARLEQHAAPGEILAGERTHAAASFGFQFDAPRAVVVKGKPQPLTVYPLLAARATRLRERPPLVGRRPDLLQLELLKSRVAEERRPHLLTLIAPAGTGKTRLLEEFIARLDAAEGFRATTARCLPYGQSLSFLPLRGLLEELLAAIPTRESVATRFQQAGYAQDEAASLANLIQAALGGESEAARDREAIFAAWRLLIAAVARQTPLIVIFEDLHWASDTLLDLLEHVTQRSADAPVLIVALSRPELLDRRPNWGGGRQNSALLALQPLSTAQTAHLLEETLPDWSPEQRGRIVERSGGNPFFALEIARGLAERGAGDDLPLPDTVHAAVLARLDLLDPLERATLQLAAVASRAVRPQMLAAILTDAPPEQLDLALEQLVARDLLLQPETGHYAFRHVLIRDVAYGTLARSERIRLHSALAAWLERQMEADALSEVIAYHYQEAVSLARQSAIPSALPFPPSVAGRALRRAGEVACRAGAFAEGLRHFQGALALADDADRLAILEQFGDAFPWGDTAYAAHRDALAAWRALPAGDPATGARLIRKLVIDYLWGFVTSARRPTPEQVEALLTEAMQLAAQAGEPRAERFLRAIELSHWARLAPPPRDRIAARLPEIADSAARFTADAAWYEASLTLDVLSLGYAVTGDIAASMASIERRLAIPGLPARERFDAVNAIVSYALLRGDYAGVIASARGHFVRLRPEESPLYLAGTLGMAMLACYLGGRWDDAAFFAPLMQTVLEMIRFDPSVGISITDAYMAALQIALAREDRPQSDAAFAALGRLMTDPAGVGRRFLAILREERLTELQEALADLPGIMLLEAIMYLNEFGVAVPDAPIDRAGDARFQIDFVDRGKAVAQALAAGNDARLAQAIDDADAHHLPIFAARMRLVLAERTGDRAWLERARPTLTAVQDRRFLRRLEEIAARLPGA